jgi:hypothetical protein
VVLRKCVLRSGDTVSMKMVLEAGADPNLGDTKPLFEVLDQVKNTGSIEMLSAFLTSSVKYVNIEVKNKDDDTSALKYAYDIGIIEAANMLIEYKQSFGGPD